MKDILTSEIIIYIICFLIYTLPQIRHDADTSPAAKAQEAADDAGEMVPAPSEATTAPTPLTFPQERATTPNRNHESTARCAVVCEPCPEVAVIST